MTFSLGEELVKFILPLQKKKTEILKDKNYLDGILNDGRIKAEDIAKKTMKEVKDKLGII